MVLKRTSAAIFSKHVRGTTPSLASRLAVCLVFFPLFPRLQLGEQSPHWLLLWQPLQNMFPFQHFEKETHIASQEVNDSVVPLTSFWYASKILLKKYMHSIVSESALILVYR